MEDFLTPLRERRKIICLRGFSHLKLGIVIPITLDSRFLLRKNTIKIFGIDLKAPAKVNNHNLSSHVYHEGSL
jgi:hypothetical protein